MGGFGGFGGGLVSGAGWVVGLPFGLVCGVLLVVLTCGVLPFLLGNGLGGWMACLECFRLPWRCSGVVVSHFGLYKHQSFLTH